MSNAFITWGIPGIAMLMGAALSAWGAVGLASLQEEVPRQRNSRVV